MAQRVTGFSKLSKEEKIDWLVANYFDGNSRAIHILKQYWNVNSQLQQLHDEFTENTLSNYYLPFGIAPNFVINGNDYVIPMAIEESSVIAAASKAAKFWQDRGGFKATVIDTEKIGQVHFIFTGEPDQLNTFFETTKPAFLSAVSSITKNMEKRGGGVLDIQLINKTTELDNYYQLHCTFETVDSMGANFINTCLEQFAETLEAEFNSSSLFSEDASLNIIMSILSNYVPNCLVRAEVSCKIEELSTEPNIDAHQFANDFVQAIKIAEVEPYRAVTHNKGIMNGIDAVVLATGNDFRAVEAGVHAYAAKNGQYSSLTQASVDNGLFTFSIEIPLALGTVGGLTNLHPLVKLALQMLGDPTARELMQIVAVAGLAQNFAAVRSLVTTGIQEGHMKMHLMNILNQMNATEQEKQQMVTHFKTETVTHSAVTNKLNAMRQN